MIEMVYRLSGWLPKGSRDPSLRGGDPRSPRLEPNDEQSDPSASFTRLKLAQRVNV